MLSVSNTFKNRINKPSREFRSRISFPALVLDDFNIQTIEFSSAIIESDDFKIGTACMANADIELFDVDGSLTNYPFEGKEVKIEIGLKLEDESFEYVTLGLFTVDRPTIREKVIHLNSVDRMYKFEKPYYSTLQYPATLGDIAQDICSVVGVEMVNIDFPNSNYIVSERPSLDDVSCRIAIAQIAELAGGYARITREGKLEIFNLEVSRNNAIYYAGNHYASNELVIADELVTNKIEITRDNYINFENSIYETTGINKVTVISGNKSVQKGIGDKNYIIEGNIFCQNPSGVIDELFNVLNGLSYIPYTANWQGNPAVDCGDTITIKTASGHFNTTVTSRSLTYAGGLREKYKAVSKGELERQIVPKGTITRETDTAKKEIQNIDEKTDSMVSVQEFTSYKQQTERELNEKVNRGIDLKNEIVTNATSWGLSINGKLQGEKYNFDGDSFTLGLNNQTTAKHTSNYSSWQHSDGSYTIANQNGLSRIINSVSNKYLDLIVIDDISTELIKDFEATVFLGDEFKGKNFVVVPFLKGIENNSNEEKSIFDLEIDVLNKNISNATVTLYGRAGIRLIEIDNDGYLKEINKEYRGLLIGYVAIA